MSPHVSIVTTVYDRVSCLAACLRSVQRSLYRDLEQIVVSDCPPPESEREIARLCAQPGVRHLSTPTRANDWGITPARLGLFAATGEYVAFLSDDNAYLPDHLGPLVAELDRDPSLDFVYSSCLYAGRMMLRSCIPQFGRIDLGQPLFRRSVLPKTLPYHELCWDWKLIQSVMRRPVNWRHLDRPTFIFRLAAYPDYLQAVS